MRFFNQNRVCQKFIAMIFFFSTSILYGASSADSMIGDAPLENVFKFDAGTRDVINLSVSELEGYKTGDVYLDTMLTLALLRTETVYKWGGDDWRKGVDCSHFTMKVYQDAAQYYNSYLTTSTLKNITNANGLRKVAKEDMQPGDLLVYGYYDEDGKWHGHVVILVDQSFRENGKKGLVVGSHGGIGVKFISYTGFPEYYRSRNITLRNILRVESPKNSYL
ncbi:MAG: NlpC/P60 family protein [Bdellovibrionota bacterium]